jgi:predicted DNA-binding transcriptional regulator AlpA
VVKPKPKTSTTLAKQIDRFDPPKTVAQIVAKTEKRTLPGLDKARKRKRPPVRGPPPPGMSRLLRFADLVAIGVVKNYASLKVLFEHYDFPRGRWISTNVHVWTRSEVEEWIAARPEADPRGSTRGRRKDEAEPAPRPKLTKETRTAKAAPGRPHPDRTDRLAPYPDEVEAEAAPAKTAAAPP